MMKYNAMMMSVIVLCLVCGIWGVAYAEEETLTEAEEEAVALVEKAGKLIEEKGDAALELISDPEGEFFIKEKALYAFVYDEEIVIIAHPYKPTLIGRSYKGKPDVRGKKFRDEIVEKAIKEGSSWTEYSYQKPEEKGIHQKKVFGKLFEHEEKKYIVCAGVYLD